MPRFCLVHLRTGNIATASPRTYYLLIVVREQFKHSIPGWDIRQKHNKHRVSRKVGRATVPGSGGGNNETVRAMEEP